MLCEYVNRFCLTIEELGALGIAIFHLLALVSSCLQVTICCGKYSCSRLDKELTDLNVVTGGSTVKGCPGDTDRRRMSS